ncbi:MAG: copper homeostasis membrane protein CopD [Sphingomicrobium sp.]|nr:copper homeostasis membrane protein CopD [Sphingomonadales bacterium]
MDSAAALIAVRFALYLDLMLVFGLPLFCLYTLRGAERRAGGNVMSSRVVVGLALAGVALSVLGLLLLAAAMSDVPVLQLDRETLGALLDGTAIGTAGKVRVAALLAALPIGFWLRSRPSALWATLSCLGAIALGSLAWTGHGAADEGAIGQIHLTADIVHLLAAGVWIGALAGLLTLLSRVRVSSDDRQERMALAHRALAGFSTAGTLAVGLIILTGLVNSWVLVGVGNIASLPGSLYGRLLILKLLIFVGMLGLAGWNRFRLTPAVEASLGTSDATAAMQSIRWSVALESTLALSVLGLVAWLGTLAPPASGS